MKGVGWMDKLLDGREGFLFLCVSPLVMLSSFSVLLMPSTGDVLELSTGYSMIVGLLGLLAAFVAACIGLACHIADSRPGAKSHSSPRVAKY